MYVHARGASIERSRGDGRKPECLIDTPTDHGQIDITGV